MAGFPPRSPSIATMPLRESYGGQAAPHTILAVAARPLPPRGLEAGGGRREAGSGSDDSYGSDNSDDSNGERHPQARAPVPRYGIVCWGRR